MLFFRTRSPVEPVSFVHKICQDLANGGAIKRCRFVKRLTPITATDKATEKGLEDVARKVLAPHFHGPDQVGKKVSFFLSIDVGCRQMMRLYMPETQHVRLPVPQSSSSQYEHLFETTRSSLEKT